MNTVIRLIVLACASLVLAVPVRADGPGVISGQVVNGTAGATVPDSHPVALGVYRGNSLENELQAQPDEAGHFRFDDLEVSSGLIYQVGTSYGDMLFRSDPVKLSESQAEQQVTLRIYESTPDDPGLRASQVYLSLSVPRDDPRELAITELVRLANPSDRTFVPQMHGVTGPMGGLVRFGLPAGATQLEPQWGLDPNQILRVDRGFASYDPVPPGDSVYRFAYRVPFQGGGDVLEKSLPYGAELLRVMSEEGGPKVLSPEFTFEQTLDTRTGGKILVWAAHDLAPGTRLNIELSDVPGVPIWARMTDVFASPLVLAMLPWLLAALIGLLPVLGVFWALRGRARPQPASTRQPLPSSLVDVVAEALVDLDDASAAGRISEPEYRSRRRELKAQLGDYLRSTQV